MTVLHTGSTRKYAENWALAFGEKKPKAAAKKKSARPRKKKR